MKRLLAFGRLMACGSLLCVGIVMASGAAGAQTAGNSEKTVTMEVEYYGWFTNTPPGCQTADSKIRDGCAGGKGTYTTPITAAVKPKDYPYGTIFYYPTDGKYFEAGDEDPMGSATTLTFWMGYLGTSTAATAGTEFALIDCEDALTTGKTPVIVTPPADEPVTAQPLFTYKTGRCYGGATSAPAFDQYKNKADKKCIENPTYGTTVGAPAKLATCSDTKSSTTWKAEDLEFTGDFFINHGLCLTIDTVTSKNPTKTTSALKWTKCTGKTTELFLTTFGWVEYTLCVGVVSAGLELNTKCSSKADEWTEAKEPSLGLPSEPAKPIASRGDESATVSWSAPKKGTFPIKRYTVTASPGEGWCVTSGLTCSVGTLTNGTSYTFTVKAWSIAGTSPTSPASTPVTPAGVPSAPGTPSATRGDHSAKVSWTAPATNGTTIISYKVTSNTGHHSCTWSSGPLTCRVHRLANGVPYTFTVTATNGVGTSTPSPPSTAVTPASVPAKPCAPTAKAGVGEAAVTWRAPTTGGSPISKYVVTASTERRTCTTTGARTCTVKHLIGGDTYTFTVKAINAVGPGPASEPSNAVTPTA